MNLEYRHYNCDNLETLSKLKDESIDVICTDPPWLYLKNQKLERPFDEDLFFSESKRVLKPNGFIILFGRGTSFYRWNMKLSDLEFKFKEEVIWNKRMISSPVLPLSRVHESISIHCKSDKGKIIKNKIPYVKMKQYDLDSIIMDINRIKVALNNEKDFQDLISYFKNGVSYNQEIVTNFAATNSKNNNCTLAATGTLNQIVIGMNEKSIIDSTRDHYDSIHPTQKPVDLMIRLLNLVCLEGSTVFDPFMGSGSTIKACLKSNRIGIGCEIDKEYYDAAVLSIEKFIEEEQLAQLKLF
jgi:site-specific DNA-methyltransferase (adenine-specific)